MFYQEDFRKMQKELERLRQKPITEQSCLTCELSHCDFFDNGVGIKKHNKCPVRKNKHNNPYRKLYNYVYTNLKLHGNTVLGEKIYNKIGEAAVLDDLKRNGFIDIYIDKNLIVTAKYDKERDENASVTCKNVRGN